MHSQKLHEHHASSETSSYIPTGSTGPRQLDRMLKQGFAGVGQQKVSRRCLLHALLRHSWSPARRRCATRHPPGAPTLAPTLGRHRPPQPHHCRCRRRRAPHPGRRRRWAATRPQTGCPAAAACPAAPPAAAQGTGQPPRRRPRGPREPRGLQPRRRRRGAPRRVHRQPGAKGLSLCACASMGDSVSGWWKWSEPDTFAGTGGRERAFHKDSGCPSAVLDLLSRSQSQCNGRCRACSCVHG